jgi:NAD(P)H-binding
VPRIIVLSSGGVVEDLKAPGFYRALIRPYLINTYTDMCRMETILEETPDLEWTCVMLTYLLKGKRKEYIAKEGMIGTGNFKIHYVDAAKFIVQELAARKWINMHPVLGYP